MGFENAFIFWKKQEVPLLSPAWYLMAASLHPSRLLCRTADPPPASLNCFHRHTNDILGVRSAALRPHTPHISLRVFEDISFSVGAFGAETEHRRSCVFRLLLWADKAEEGISGPGSSGESAWNDGIHHFQVNLLLMSFVEEPVVCPIMGSVTLHLVLPRRTRAEQLCVEMTTQRKRKL